MAILSSFLPLFGRSVVIEKVKVYEIWQTPAWLWIFSLKNVNDISALFWRLRKAIHNVKHTCVPHYITGGAKLQPHQTFLFEKILNIKKNIVMQCNYIVGLLKHFLFWKDESRCFHYLSPLDSFQQNPFLLSQKHEWWAKYEYRGENPIIIASQKHNLWRQK